MYFNNLITKVKLFLLKFKLNTEIFKTEAVETGQYAPLCRSYEMKAVDKQ